MNTQFTYVDTNNAYIVARSSNEHNVSASPSFINHASNYAQGPRQNNLHASTSYDFSDVQHMYPNSHASATPQIHLKHLMLKFPIAYKKVFHLFIHRQLICNM